MNEVRLTRRALLSLVFLRGKQVSATQQIEVGLRVVVRDFLDDVFDTNNLEKIITKENHPQITQKDICVICGWFSDDS